MKNIFIVIPLIVFAACGPQKSKEIKELIARRDSLQNAQLAIEMKINKLNAEIAALDTNKTMEEIQLIRKIAQQKNRVVAMNKKVKKLENELATYKKKHDFVPVAIKEMKGEEFKHHIIVYGKVEADKYAQISPEMSGRIEKIYVSEGERVNDGQLLVTLNTDAIQKQIDGVKSSLKLATSTFEKQETLWNQGIGSELQYLQAKNTKENLEAQLETLEAQLRMAQIRAPFNGIVDKIYPKVGEIAGPGFPVVEFVNLGKMNIKADVSENYIGKVKVGQIVEVTFSSLLGDTITTPIVRASKVIDDKSRTFEIKLKINNYGNKIKPNMVSTIKINDFSSDNAFVVPSLVIRKDISGSYVYVVVEKDNKTVVEKKYITTSLSYNENTMITSGLDEGDKVVVAGYHMVSAGVPVKISSN